MMRWAVLIVAAFLFSPVAAARTKTKVFNQPCTTVFPAAEKLASAKPYRLELDGKADMSLIVSTGSFWKLGSQRIVVQFKPGKNNTCTVNDNARYSGAMRNGTVFLNRLEKALAAKKKDVKPAT